MSKKNIFEWCEKPWNPIAGCDPLSMGCENCYAWKIAAWCQRMDQLSGELQDLLKGS